ncbi:MAG: PTS sugar transporter subunit IIB [Tissierellia bacterium]|jgi:mannose/fructose/N-acetylgalactosamine-specific phosphotransferase system component IIB|nr:PTS sugar transporter subunit IIB [Tissierellia bacterium]MDD3226183.1 PTS sugar transporter subunit IIB [Tissierellia bacterium]MDD3750526.1 PTS sugar transporter subunit IIB [Tissierellia bacterium]MDD4045817.1 PTS sugar transporter subunit IIB [Tissierellia bacterium]MDD4677971.1 PTS sugar transporter subunit IIB [Tissierellia bacterium]
MKNIFVRIDDRLLHGQVVVSWIPYLKVNEVVIADDEYANDEFMKELIKCSEPEGVTVHVKTIDETAALLNNDNENKILVLLRSIEGIKELVKKVKISNINIGGVGAAEGRKRYYNSIHLSDNELSILKDIANDNIHVEVRILPKDKAIVIKGN